MVRKKTIYGLLLFLVFLPAFSWRRMPNTAFGVGEEMEFEMGWKAATAGSALLKVTGQSVRKKRSAYKIVCEGSTNEVIDLVFHVRDRLESWMDVEALCSLGSARRINEGPTVIQEDVFIDPVARRFQLRKAKPSKGSGLKQEEGPTPAYVQDVVSALYYVRTQTLTIGKSVPITVMNGSDFVDVDVRVLRKENKATSFGTFSCFVLEPIVKAPKDSGKFDKTRVYIWMTDDLRHLPIEIAADLPFGEITATLTRYKK